MPSGQRLENKVAIVTGAGTRGEIAGTGQAASILMAREGAKVLLSDIDIDRAEETLNTIEKEGGTAKIFIGDVTSEKDCEAMVNESVKQFGKLDILFNNVGGPGGGMVTEIEEEDWHRSIDLNMKSAVMGSKYAIPTMEKSGGGSIINVSSIDGTQAGSTRNVPYSISKAAISHLSRIMAVHHGRQNIRVNCVAPGHVYGAFPNRFKKMEDDWRELRKKAGPLGTEGTAWDVAWAVVYLASDEAKWVTGVILPVDAGVQAASPLSMLGDIIGSDEPKSNLY
ncbi:MAG: short-chain dehydrogenase [Chloroflexi bacterium]|nr:short-chain dehydrogenase [Chloroflexota bacterium]MQF96873.1 SDR family oxidoreductase [SAR202 cluster bacterium]RZP16961.1 MAG: SDR family oxidoreductase [Chloroflexota bacterium]|tara:strand:+ start:2234 stop:3076 length:843 start_codon:yes stop_codon:yes gene_type:complete